MNTALYKTNDSDFRVTQLTKLAGIFNSNHNVQSQFNIEGEINMLFSISNQESPDILLLNDILTKIASYYTNLNFSHNYDVILNNQMIFPILNNLISRNNSAEIRRSSFMVILALISFNEDILLKFIEYGLYSKLFDILADKNYDMDGYFIVSRLLFCIFSYQNGPIIQQFLNSPLPDHLIKLLIHFSYDRLDDTQTQFIIDAFSARQKSFLQFDDTQLNAKYPQERLPSEVKQNLFLKASFEDLIFAIIQHLYHDCGSPNDDTTDSVLRAMTNIISTANKTYLVSQVAYCLTAMINVSRLAQEKSVENGLIQCLNNFLSSYQFEIAWPYIICADITILKNFKEKILKSSNDKEKELYYNLVTQILNSVTPSKLFILITQVSKEYGEKEVQYQEKFDSSILECFSLIFYFNHGIIVEDIGENENRELFLTLGQFRQILDVHNLSDDGISYCLKEKGILFVFAAIDTQNYLSVRLDIINILIGEYHALIPFILQSSSDEMKKLILIVLIKLANKLIINENQDNKNNSNQIIDFLNSDDMSSSTEELQKSDDRELLSLLDNFTDMTEKMFS